MILVYRSTFVVHFTMLVPLDNCDANALYNMVSLCHGHEGHIGCNISLEWDILTQCGGANQAPASTFYRGTPLCKAISFPNVFFAIEKTLAFLCIGFLLESHVIWDFLENIVEILGAIFALVPCEHKERWNKPVLHRMKHEWNNRNGTLQGSNVYMST